MEDKLTTIESTLTNHETELEVETLRAAVSAHDSELTALRTKLEVESRTCDYP